MIERRLVRDAALYFLVSRALILFLMVAGSQISFLGKVYSGSVWETRITLQAERVVPELVRVAMVGDAWWYRSVTLHGYSAAGAKEPNWAFFPLFPMLIRAAGVTGDFALDGMLLSHAAFAISLLLLGPVLVRTGFSFDDASRAMFYLAFFPTSYFFSLPVTESLFLALSLGAVLAGTYGRWWLAGLLGGLGALTRAPGILLLLPLAVLFVERRERPWWRITSLLLIPAGLLTFMWHLHSRTGDALAFVHAQRGWGRLAQPFWQPMVDFALHPEIISQPWNPVAANLLVAILLLAAAIGFAVRRQWVFAVYALASLLLPLGTGSVQSLARYAAVAFPVHAALAILGRRDGFDRTISGISIVLLGWLVAFLVLRVDFALA